MGSLEKAPKCSGVRMTGMARPALADFYAMTACLRLRSLVSLIAGCFKGFPKDDAVLTESNHLTKVVRGLLNAALIR